VSDICKKAELNRSTFYANYVDIYELADIIREKLEAQVSKLYKDEMTKRFNSNNYLVLFQHIKVFIVLISNWGMMKNTKFCNTILTLPKSILAKASLSTIWNFSKAV
jgi:AcrR family transcriptional regulator